MKTVFLILAFFWSLVLVAQTNLDICIPEAPNEKIYLVNYVGNKQFYRDSFQLNERGEIVISKNANYPGGLYLLYVPNKGKKYQEFYLSDDQSFEWKITELGRASKCNFTGSDENQLFLTYLSEAEKFKIDVRALEAQLNRLKKEGKSDSINWCNQAISTRKNQFNQYKIDFSITHSTFACGKYVSFLARPVLDQQLSREQQAIYYKDNFFRYANLSDELATAHPAFLQLVEEYFLGLSNQAPDSLKKAADYLLSKTAINPALYRLTLAHLVYLVSSSNAICTDAIYVHLIDNYYSDEKAPWMLETDDNKKQLNKMRREADALRPSMCGATAFNLTLKNNQGKLSPIFENDANYDHTLLIFWDPECEHCEVLMKKLAEQPAWIKEKKIRLVAIAAIEGWEGKSIPTPVNGMNYYWATTVEETGVVFRHYLLGTTPEIFILDRQHTIQYKDLRETDFEKAIQKL